MAHVTHIHRGECSSRNTQSAAARRDLHESDSSYVQLLNTFGAQVKLKSSRAVFHL